MSNPFPADLGDRIREQARRLGFDAVGIAPVTASEHADFYRHWLEASRHGEMAYLARPDAVDRRARPDLGWPGVRSAIVVAHNYYVPDGQEEAPGDEGGATRRASAADIVAEATAGDPARGIIARYARGREYHKVIKKKLLALLDWIETETGRAMPMARAYVDTGPVLERELARRAGLGWFGRNTMLIHPRRGSYFFLGVLLLEPELEPDAPFEDDHCGTCNACVEACPTGALLGRDETGAPVIDATRCISYLTIEHRGPIPRELRPLIGNRIFGCDICQEVCPWNSPKFVELTNERDYRAGWRETPDRSTAAPVPPAAMSPSLIDLMHMTREKWDAWTRGSALRRAGYTGFKRNVAVALGNWLASISHTPAEAVAALIEALSDPEPLVRGHAAWALGRLRAPEAGDALRTVLAYEQDPSVREEFERALGR